MPAQDPCTVDLSGEQASYVDDLVRSGRYSSRREVVEAGLRALQEGDVTTDEWLRRDVVPVVRSMQADPDRAVPARQVFDEIRALNAERLETPDRAV